MDCVQKLVDISALPDEIGKIVTDHKIYVQTTKDFLLLEKAKPNGNLDLVFNKYCNKRSDALECVDEFTKSLDPCLSTEEKEQKVVFINITKSLLEFVCHENGNQIACKK